MTSASSTSLPAVRFDPDGIQYVVSQEKWQRKGLIGKWFGTGEKIVVEVTHSRNHTIDFIIKTHTQNFWERIGSLFTREELSSVKNSKTFKKIIISEKECDNVIVDGEPGNINKLKNLKVTDLTELSQDRDSFQWMEKIRLKEFLDSPQVDLFDNKINNTLKTGFTTAISKAAQHLIKIKEGAARVQGVPSLVHQLAAQTLIPTPSSESHGAPIPVESKDDSAEEVPVAESKYGESYNTVETSPKPLETSFPHVVSPPGTYSALGPEKPSEPLRASTGRPSGEVKFPIRDESFLSIPPSLSETEENFAVVPFRASDERGIPFSSRRDLAVIIDQLETLSPPHLKLLPVEQRRDAFLDLLDGIIRRNFGQGLELEALRRESNESNFKLVLAEHLDKAIPQEFSPKKLLAIEHVPDTEAKAGIRLDPEFFYEVAVPFEASHLIDEIEVFLHEQDVREAKSPHAMAMQLAQNLPITEAFSKYIKGIKKELLANLDKHQSMMQKALHGIPQHMIEAEIFDAAFLSNCQQVVDDLGQLSEEYEVPVLGGWAGKRVKAVADLDSSGIKSYARTIEGAMAKAHTILRTIKNTLIVTQQFEKTKESAVKKHSQLMLEGHYSQAYALRNELDQSDANFKNFAKRNLDISNMAAVTHHLTSVIGKLSKNAKPLPLPLQLSKIGDETSPEALNVVSSFIQAQQAKIQQFQKHVNSEFSRFSASDHSLLKLNSEARDKIRKLIQTQMESLPVVPSEFPEGEDLVLEMQALEDNVEAAMQKITQEIEKMIDIHFYLPGAGAISEVKESKRISTPDALVVRRGGGGLERPRKARSALQTGLATTLSEFEGMIVQFEKFLQNSSDVQSESARHVLALTFSLACPNRSLLSVCLRNVLDILRPSDMIDEIYSEMGVKPSSAIICSSVRFFWAIF